MADPFSGVPGKLGSRGTPVPKMGTSFFAVGRALSLAAALLASGCLIAPERLTCALDVDCPDDQLCYVDELRGDADDARCVPPNVARGLGAVVGDECFHSGGTVTGCEFTCLMQLCDGPPRFTGAEVAISDGPTTLIVSWLPPVDRTFPESLRYRIYWSRTPAGQDYSAPNLALTGGTTARLEDLVTNTPYYVVVRVEDEFGQTEENENEARGVPGCIEYGTQIAPLITGKCTGCHGEAEPERGLRLDSVAALRSGTPGRPMVVECRSDLSRIVRRAGEPHALDSRRGPHGGLDTEQLDVLAAWIDEGAQDRCPNDRGVCADTVPPTFAGVTSATAMDATTVELCWDAGTDDRASVAQLVYDVYEAPLAFDRLPAATSDPGATCITLSGRIPDADYCWVVRARDGSGNADSGMVEECVTMPSAACLEYADVIQPLFDAHCIHCHGGEGALVRLRLTSFEGVMFGGGSGAIAIACDPDASLLMARLGTDPPRDIRMPGDGPPYLTDAQLAAVRRWLAEGARSSCTEADPC